MPSLAEEVYELFIKDPSTALRYIQSLSKPEKRTLDAALERYHLQRHKTNYESYVEYTHQGRWKRSRHLSFVCDKVQRFLEEKTKNAFDILILSMPPQHGKSMTITETLPSWYLGNNPTHRVIVCSYNDDTAERFCRRNKEKIKEFGKKVFDIEVSKRVDRATAFDLSNGVGSMISRGMLGGVTSNPAELFIIDDPIKNRADADSETIRDKIWEEWVNSIKTRFQAGTKVILIQTRWHEDDLAGRILINESHTTVINLPCEAEEDDPLGRPVGAALAPEIGKDDDWLRDFKLGYQSIEGNRAWNALFQGRPTVAEGNLIKKHWFRYWCYPDQKLPPVEIKLPDGTTFRVEADPLPPFWDEQIQSWDCTFKDGEHNDFVCGGVLARRVANYYLLDLKNAHLDIVKTMEAIEAFRAKYPKAHKILIEGKANGSAVVQILRRKMHGLIEVEPEGGKEARASAVSPAIQSGNYYIPHPLIADWVHEYIKQMTSFPNGTHDDMVDMTTQALNVLMYKSGDSFRESKIKQGGTYSRGELKLLGFGESKINQMIKSGVVRLLGR